MARILLIDDDMVLLTLYKTRLVADGHEVQTAQNGEDGFALAKKNQPDLVVLDLLMPKLNGFSLLEQIRADEQLKDLHIVVFSSVALGEQLERLSTLGVTTCLNKITTTPTQLVSIVQEQLAMDAR